MDFSETDQLLDLMRQRHECLGQLATLGQRQLELIAADDFGQLMRVLSAKQRLLVSLTALERRLDPFRPQQPEARRWRSEATRSQCAQLMSRCQAFLGQIVRQEQQSQHDLQRQRDDAASRLQTMHAVVGAAGAYAAAEAAPLAGLDLSTEG
jgi:hypothetical protein